MIRTIIAVATLAAAAAPASAGYVYMLGANGQDQSGAMNRILVWRSDNRVQFVYDRANFAEAGRIDGFTLRYARSYAADLSDPVYNFGDAFAVRLGTINGPVGLAFDDNINATTRTVAAGARTIATTRGGGVGDVKDWGIDFAFDTPFDYDPAAGDLVVDMSLTWGLRPMTVDALQSGAVGHGIGPNTARGLGFYNVPVARFRFNDPVTPGGGPSVGPPPSAVPEPATWAMLIVGFGLVGTVARGSSPAPRRREDA